MKKTLEGKVVSVAMQHTAVVEVIRVTPHPLYKKLLRRSKKYKVDTAGTQVTVGDVVKIVETRPMSKNKYFRILREKQKEQKVEPIKKTETAQKPKRYARTKKKGEKE